METSTNVKAITPVLTKDVSFTEKVHDVETALKSRSTAQREIKTKWAAVVKLLQQHDLSVPYRRPDPSTVVGYIKEVRVYKPLPEVPAEMKTLFESEGNFEVRHLPAEAVKLLDKKFAGFSA